MGEILQLDGFDDNSSNGSEQEKNIFGVNCEIRKISDLINFFRSFNFLWICMEQHTLCNIEQSCFFCNMRSSCLRLRQLREKGPRCLKLNEFICQLDKYVSILKWDWTSSNENLKTFIENTLKLKF